MPQNYQALYRKWRPLTFEDLVGQEHVTQTLRHSINSGHIGHAYLFCGTRGTGKTSAAKIFSRAVNCENPKDGDPCNECATCRGILDGSIMDVYEMDAASNNGVDKMRELREEVIYAPSGGKYKVYIIDEAHALTTDAWNALLKTLEEPPAHIIFILATTEPHKIPQTILSRCQRYDFRRIGIDEIAKRIEKITDAENIKITPDARELVAELADGSMRDGLSILEQCAAYGKEELRRADVAEIVGIADSSVLFEIAEYVLEGDCAKALSTASGFLEQGKEAPAFLEDFISHYRALLLCKAAENPSELLEKTAEAAEKYSAQAKNYPTERILYSITTLSDCLAQAKWMSSPAIAVDMAVVRLCNPQYSRSDAAIISRLEALERQIASLQLAPLKQAEAAQTKQSKKAAVQAKPQPDIQQQTVTNQAKTELAEQQPDMPPWGDEPQPEKVEPIGENSTDIQNVTETETTAETETETKAEPPAQQEQAAPVSAANGTAWHLWNEALSVIKEQSKSLYAFMYNAKAFDNGDAIEIVLTSKLAYERIATPNGIEYLSKLFTQVGGKPLTAKVSVGDKTPTPQPSEEAKPNVTSIMDIVSKKELLGDKMTIIDENSTSE